MQALGNAEETNESAPMHKYDVTEANGQDLYYLLDKVKFSFFKPPVSGH